jgi:sugar-specific transcriptional regulator TrmB
LSNGKVLEILIRIGLAQSEAEVYLYLVTEGPKKKENLANEMQMTSIQLHSTLRRLQERGVVIAEPARFVALPFEKMFDMFAKSRLEEAEEREMRRVLILAQWRSFVERNSSK